MRNMSKSSLNPLCYLGLVAKLLRATISSFFPAVRAHVLHVRSARSSEKASTSCRSLRFALCARCRACYFRSSSVTTRDSQNSRSVLALRTMSNHQTSIYSRLTSDCRYEIVREPATTCVVEIYSRITSRITSHIIAPPSHGYLLAMRHATRSGAERDRTDDLRLAKPALSQLSYSPEPRVGQGRVELPTSRLSGVRSNHLSYWPSVPLRACLPACCANRCVGWALHCAPP